MNQAAHMVSEQLPLDGAYPAAGSTQYFREEQNNGQQNRQDQQCAEALLLQICSFFHPPPDFCKEDQPGTLCTLVTYATIYPNMGKSSR